MSKNNKSLSERFFNNKKLGKVLILVGLALLIIILFSYYYSTPSSIDPNLPFFPIINWLYSHNYLFIFTYLMFLTCSFIGLGVAILNNFKLFIFFLALSVALIYIGIIVFIYSLLHAIPVATPIGVVYVNIYSSAAAATAVMGFGMLLMLLFHWALLRTNFKGIIYELRKRKHSR